MLPVTLGRWPRRVLYLVGGVCLLIAGILALLQISPVATWAGRRLAGLAPLAPGARLEIGRVSGSWVGGLTLHDVVLERGGRRLAALRTVRVSYDPRGLLSADRRLSLLLVEGARIHTRRQGGTWDITQAFRTSADTTGGGGTFAVDRVVLRDIGVVAELTPDSIARVERLEMRARDLVLAEQATVAIDSLTARLSPPTDSLIWLSLAARGAATPDVLRLDTLRLDGDRSRLAGRVTLPRTTDDERVADQLDVRVVARPLALGDFAGIVPAVAPGAVLDLDLQASAEGRRAEGRLEGRLKDGGRFRFDGVTMLGAGAQSGYRVVGEVRELDPASVAAAGPEGVVNADIDVDLGGGPLAEADGRADLRLAESRIGTSRIDDLRLRATFDSGRADLDLRGAMDRGRVAATGWARPFDSVPSYRLAGHATGLPGTDSLAALLAGAEGEPALDVGFRLGGRGASAEDASVSGRATLEAVRKDGTRTDLGHATVELAERRLRLVPVLLVAGGRVSATVSGRLDDPITYTLRNGVIERVDLGRLTGDTVAAPVSGRFELTGRGSAPEQASARGRIELDEVRYGARRLEAARADFSLDRGKAALTVRGRLQGGRVELVGEGRPLDSTPAFTVRRAAMDSVDLGTLLGRADLAGPVTARLGGSGRWGDAAKTFRGRLEVEPSTLGHIRVSDGAVGVGLAGGRLTFDGALATSAGTVALAGEGRPLDSVPTLAVRRGRADSLDLGAALNRPGLSTRIGARFTAETEGTVPDSMRARFALELDPSRVNRAEIRSGRADLTLDRGRLRGEVRAEGEDGELLTKLSGSITGPARRIRAEGAMRVEHLARWTGDSARDGRLDGRFTLDGAADSVGLVGLAGTITANGALDSVRLDTLQIALSPEPRVLRVDTLVIRSNVAALDGGGRLALAGGDARGDTLRVTGTMRDPMPLVTLAGADSVSLDSARVRLTATGPASRRRVGLNGTVHRLLYAGNQVERLTAAGNAQLDSAGLAAAAGTVDVEGGAVGTILIRRAKLAGRYDSVVALDASAVLRDSIAIRASLRGTAAGDTVRGTLERFDIAENGRRWALERPAAFALEPPRYGVQYFSLRAGDRRLALDGVLDRKGTSDLSVELRRLDLAPLQQLGLAPFGGQADANLRLTGPADAPSLVADLRAQVTPVEGGQPGRIGTRIQWTAEGLRLDAEAAHEPGGRLNVAGTLPYRFTLAPADTASAVGVTRREGDTLGVTVRSDRFDLAFFEPFLPQGSAEKLGGTLAVNGRIAGTMERPRAEGTVALRGMMASLPAIGVDYTKGELAGRLDGDRFTVERLRLVTDNDGELTATGTVRLTPLDDPALDLAARLKEFRVSNSATLRTIATGRLQIAGTAAKPVMTGALKLGRSEIVSGTETAAAANVEKVELTAADLQQLAREFGPAVLARAEEKPGLVDRFKLDIDVVLPRRIWFRQRGSMKADIEIAGRLKVRQEPGQKMGFFGEVETVPGRGSLELYGREFSIQEGDITLAGPPENVTLDVTAEYQVPTQADPGDDGILIDVNATGRPDSLKLAFSSEPTMSEDDIVSYIVTGQPASENPLARKQSGEGQGAAEMGAEVALGRLSESVAGAAGEALGLDVFQIRQDGLRGLTLTAGRYVASRVFLSLQQPIQLSSDAQQSSSSSYGPGFELEYAARRWLRANLRGGNVPPRFFIRGRHAF
jgi:translocation and assembly module TamB